MPGSDFRVSVTQRCMWPKTFIVILMLTSVSAQNKTKRRTRSYSAKTHLESSHMDLLSPLSPNLDCIDVTDRRELASTFWTIAGEEICRNFRLSCLPDFLHRCDMMWQAQMYYHVNWITYFLLGAIGTTVKLIYYHLYGTKGSASIENFIIEEYTGWANRKHIHIIHDIVGVEHN